MSLYTIVTAKTLSNEANVLINYNLQDKFLPRRGAPLDVVWLLLFIHDICEEKIIKICICTLFTRRLWIRFPLGDFLDFHFKKKKRNR